MGNSAHVSAKRRVADTLAGDQPMDRRDRFIQDKRLALYWMTELCARYG
jgi:hypothetical protein